MPLTDLGQVSSDSSFPLLQSEDSKTGREGDQREYMERPSTMTGIQMIDLMLDI